MSFPAVIPLAFGAAARQDRPSRRRAAGTGAACAGRSGVASGAREARLSASMAAAQAGDAAAYQDLLRECVPMIAAAVRAAGLRGDGVDDVVQDTLLTVHRARATYDPARPFTAWLRAIAQRRAIDAMRRNGRRRAREVYDPEAYEYFADAGPEVEAGLAQADRVAQLDGLLAGLPPRQREAIDRLALSEESLEEAARRTGRSKVALKVNLHRALKALRGRHAAGGRDDA